MAQTIGKVKAGSGKSYDVKWNSGDRTVYVSPTTDLWGPTIKVGQASSASEAMVKAEAAVYNK